MQFSLKVTMLSADGGYYSQMADDLSGEYPLVLILVTSKKISDTVTFPPWE
jgi:hypothetical protein